MPKQDLSYAAQEGPFLLSTAGEAEGQWETAFPTPETDVPAFTQEATQGRWGLMEEALEGPGSLAESSEFEPYGGLQSAITPGSHELTENEIGALFGNNRSLIALHWLLGSSDLRQATLAALLGATHHRSIRVRGSHIPLPKYLRLLARLCSEVAEQAESEQGEQARADASLATNLRTVPYGDHEWQAESELGSPTAEQLWEGLIEEAYVPRGTGSPGLGPLERYFLPADPNQRLLPRVVEASARPFVGGDVALAAMRADIAAATGPNDFIYMANWYCDIDLQLVPGDATSTLRAMLGKAAGAGVQVRAMFWAALDPPAASEIAKIVSPAAAALYEAVRWLVKKIFDSKAANRAMNSNAANFINSLAPRADMGALLDTSHQIFGSHHQKLLVLGLQGSLVAHVGGIEYHADRLTNVKSELGSPLFDTSVRLEGPAAWLALDTFVGRWQAHPANKPDKRPALRGAGLPTPPSSGGTLAVQVTHTYGKKYPYSGAVLSASKAVANGIQSGQQFLYMEDQYFVGSPQMDAAFRAALSGSQSMVVIITIAAEDCVSDLPDLPYRRRAFLRPLATSFPGRFLVFERLGSSSSTTGETAYVHSKLLIVDDEALLIGSVNSSRRSWSHDTEVHTTIVDAKGPGRTQAGTRGWVRDFRCTLWSKHLLRPATSLGDPLADLAIWKGIAGGTVSGASVLSYDVFATPKRPSYKGVQVPARILDKYWDIFADPP